MFKKIKKLYFKIYHLFKLIGIFIVVFGFKENVKAITLENYQSQFAFAEESCTENLFYPVLFNSSRINPNNNYYVEFASGKSSYFIKVKPSTEYTISNINSTSFSGAAVFSLNTTTSNPKNIKSVNTNSNTTFTTFSDTNYIGFYFTSYSFPDFTNILPLLNEGSTSIEFTEYNTICTPPTPPTPSNNPFSSFISIFIDRFTYLTEGFTSNPYLITFIGIIFSFVALELFFKILHLKGGRHK